MTDATGESILEDVKRMLTALEADRAFGPYTLYLPLRGRLPRRVKRATNNPRRQKLIARWFVRNSTRRRSRWSIGIG